MESTRSLEYRDMIYPISQNHPAFTQMISCITDAKKGDHLCYKSHPDYIKRVHNIGLGDFPNNIEKIIWCHVGFEGSILPNPVPRSSMVEIHGLLKLNMDLYLRFIFTYSAADCRLVATASPRRRHKSDQPVPFPPAGRSARRPSHRRRCSCACRGGHPSES